MNVFNRNHFFFFIINNNNKKGHPEIKENKNTSIRERETGHFFSLYFYVYYSLFILTFALDYIYSHCLSKRIGKLEMFFSLLLFQPSKFK